MKHVEHVKMDRKIEDGKMRIGLNSEKEQKPKGGQSPKTKAGPMERRGRRDYNSFWEQGKIKKMRRVARSQGIEAGDKPETHKSFFRICHKPMIRSIGCTGPMSLDIQRKEADPVPWHVAMFKKNERIKKLGVTGVSFYLFVGICQCQCKGAKFSANIQTRIC